MGLFSKILSKITGKPNASAQDWEELEAALLEADLGPEIAHEVLQAARSVKSDSATEAIISALTSSLCDTSRAIAKFAR